MVAKECVCYQYHVKLKLVCLQLYILIKTSSKLLSQFCLFLTIDFFIHFRCQGGVHEPPLHPAPAKWPLYFKFTTFVFKKFPYNVVGAHNGEKGNLDFLSGKIKVPEATEY